MTLEILMQIQVQRIIEGRATTVGDVHQWLDMVKQWPQVTDATPLTEVVDLSVTFDDTLTLADGDDQEGDHPLHYEHGVFGTEETREEVVDRGQC